VPACYAIRNQRAGRGIDHACVNFQARGSEAVTGASPCSPAGWIELGHNHQQLEHMFAGRRIEIGRPLSGLQASWQLLTHLLEKCQAILCWHDNPVLDFQGKNDELRVASGCGLSSANSESEQHRQREFRPHCSSSPVI
jgi:hypothetical protein